MNYGRAITELAMEKGMTMTEVGERCGVSAAHVSQLCLKQEKCNPTAATISKMSAALGVAPSELVARATFDQDTTPKRVLERLSNKLRREFILSQDAYVKACRTLGLRDAEALALSSEILLKTAAHTYVAIDLDKDGIERNRTWQKGCANAYNWAFRKFTR